MHFRKWFCLISLHLAIFCQIAFAETPENKWIGFKAATDAAVPMKIRDAAKSVFRISFPFGPFEILNLNDLSDLDAIIKKHADDDWILLQLAYCRVQQIVKCPVSSKDQMGGGSAFVVRNSRTLATNLHNLHPWINAVIVNNDWNAHDIKSKLKNLVVPIILSDQNQNVVFNPIEALSSGAYQIEFINDDPRLFTKDINSRQLLFALSDYIELQFKNEFNVSPLQIAQSSVADRYYVVGFPGPTDLFTKLGGGDSDGLHQMVSTGTSTPLELSTSPGTAIAQKKYFTRITAPGYFGNSGGPVLNSEGKVAGILSDGDLFRQIDSKPAFYSEFINIQKQNDLKRTWSTGQP
jgi:S1-C subfamily serine protease